MLTVAELKEVLDQLPDNANVLMNWKDGTCRFIGALIIDQKHPSFAPDLMGDKALLLTY